MSTPYARHLRVAVLPLDIHWADKAFNLESVRKAFTELPEGTELVVLPELFSTGYADDPDMLHELAERNTGRTIDFMKALAARHHVAIAGSFLANTPPNIYNRAFFIEPSGEEYFYDKRHLFSVSSEARYLRAGTERPAPLRYRGWNIAMIVCYDLRFPVWSRNVDNAYDMLIVPANWPGVRAFAWEHLLIARAIENQCAVIGANRGGEDCYGNYDNLCYIFNCYGQNVGSKAGPFIIADLDRGVQDNYRTKFPVVKDVDKFELK